MSVSLVVCLSLGLSVCLLSDDLFVCLLGCLLVCLLSDCLFLSLGLSVSLSFVCLSRLSVYYMYVRTCIYIACLLTVAGMVRLCYCTFQATKGLIFVGHTVCSLVLLSSIS